MTKLVQATPDRAMLAAERVSGAGLQVEEVVAPRCWGDYKMGESMDDERLCSFHVGQVWQSPRGFMYKVKQVQIGTNAVLRMGENGTGKKVVRAWDGVRYWILVSDGV